MSSNNVLLAVALIPTLSFLIRALHALFFHPLSRLPSPSILHRISNVPSALSFLRGRLPRDVLSWHLQLKSDVLHIAPDEVVFVKPEAWRDVYGRRGEGELLQPDKKGSSAPSVVDELPKHPDTYIPFPNLPRSIGNEDRDEHRHIRGLLALRFSDRAIARQEGVVGSLVDLLVRRLRERCEGNAAKDGQDLSGGEPGWVKLDLKAWYNFTTFDVIGCLAFSETFSCLETGQYHPWVKTVEGTARQLGAIVTLNSLGLRWVVRLIGRLALGSRVRMLRHMRDKINRRMELGESARDDFITPLLENREAHVSRPPIPFLTLFIGRSSTSVLGAGPRAPILVSLARCTPTVYCRPGLQERA